MDVTGTHVFITKYVDNNDEVEYDGIQLKGFLLLTQRERWSPTTMKIYQMY